MSLDRNWLNHLKTFGMAQGLETTYALSARLGMPQSDIPGIHIAGSNGKGTCAAIMSNAISMTGTTCGLFTSPHLCYVEERIRIDGEPISTQSFDECLAELRAACDQEPKLQPTYFEATYLIALLAFRKYGVLRAVYETGLGGRLDATRTAEADLCVLTDLALEHTDVLGETLEEIALEKAAIARQGATFVATWTYDEAARDAIKGSVPPPQRGYWWRPDRELLFTWFEDEESHRPIPNDPGFTGFPSYHDRAAKLAQAALSVSSDPRLILAAEYVPMARIGTQWPGRMQWLEHEGVPVLFDAAHNPSGMAQSCKQIIDAMEQDEAPTPGVVILASGPQTDMIGFLQPLVELIVTGEVGKVILTESSSYRRTPIRANVLADELASHLPEVELIVERDSFTAAYRAVEISNESDPASSVLVLGSIYLAGDVMKALELDSWASLSLVFGEEDFELMGDVEEPTS